jgi:hypothetical protein
MLKRIIQKCISETQVGALFTGLVAAAIAGYRYDVETAFFTYLTVSVATYFLLTCNKYRRTICEEIKSE